MCCMWQGAKTANSAIYNAIENKANGGRLMMKLMMNRLADVIEWWHRQTTDFVYVVKTLPKSNDVKNKEQDDNNTNNPSS
jgi:hypothetical protein